MAVAPGLGGKDDAKNQLRRGKNTERKDWGLKGKPLRKW